MTCGMRAPASALSSFRQPPTARGAHWRGRVCRPDTCLPLDWGDCEVRGAMRDAECSRVHTDRRPSPSHWDHCMGRMLQVKNSDASSRFYHKSIAHTSQSILRQHIQAIKQLQRCKCATMLARNTARSSHAGAYGDHGPEICCANPGPSNCTERNQNRRESHERNTDARIQPILMCGLRGVAELSAAQGRGELLKRHHTR